MPLNWLGLNDIGWGCAWLYSVAYLSNRTVGYTSGPEGGGVIGFCFRS